MENRLKVNRNGHFQFSYSEVRFRFIKTSSKPRKSEEHPFRLERAYVQAPPRNHLKPLESRSHWRRRRDSNRRSPIEGYQRNGKRSSSSFFFNRC